VTEFDDRDRLLEELGKALAHGLELAGKLEVAEAEVERLREEVANLRELVAATEALKGIDVEPLNRAMAAAAEAFEEVTPIQTDP
jgi:ribosomal 50S subunit-associated protein YjgA (DUF615 family)